MKAILEFDLPEEQEEYDMCNRARKNYCILWDISQATRALMREKISEKEAIQQVQEYISEFMAEE